MRKVSPKNFDIKFDTESYLHEDRIREMINMEHLEQTLDEVLTISTDDMDDMLKSPGLSSHSSGRKLAVLQHGHCDVFLSILSIPPQSMQKIIDLNANFKMRPIIKMFANFRFQFGGGRG